MRVSTEDLVELVNRKGLPMAEVMELTGMTRQGIWKRLKKVGEHVLRRAPGGAPCKVVEQSCAFCGAPVKKYRKRMGQGAQMKAYCNMQCYADSLATHPYVEWRQGCRRARVLVSQHYPLQDEQIVHHKDGDQRNNALANLMVFASNADHVAHHRGRAVPVLFDGAMIR